jgi:hypothetical protein
VQSRRPLIVEALVANVLAIEERSHGIVAMRLSPEGVLHHEAARLAQQRVIGVECRPHRPSGIPSRRVHVQIVESRLLQDLPVGHTVQPDASGQAQPRQPSAAPHRVGHVQDQFFRHRLDARGEIGVVLVPPRSLGEVRGARTEVRGVTRALREEVLVRVPRLPEQRGQFPRVRPMRGAMEVEVLHVQAEAPVGRHPDQLADVVHVARRPIRRHAHDLVLALVHLETEEGGERGTGA